MSAQVIVVVMVVVPKAGRLSVLIKHIELSSSAEMRNTSGLTYGMLELLKSLVYSI